MHKLKMSTNLKSAFGNEIGENLAGIGCKYCKLEV